MTDENKRFPYSAHRGDFLSFVGPMLILSALELLLWIGLVLLLVHAPWLKVGLLAFITCVTIFAVIMALGPLWTHHELTATHLRLRQGFLFSARIPRVAIVAARLAEKGEIVGNPAARYEAKQRRLLAVFSRHEQILLTVHPPVMWPRSREGLIASIVLNVDDPEALLAALAVPERAEAAAARDQCVREPSGKLGRNQHLGLNPSHDEIRIHSELKTQSSKPKADALPALLIDHLTRRYGSLVAVDELTLAVRGGEIYSFLGCNGAGKTTTIRAAVGLLPPDSGRVLAAGHDVWAAPLAAKAAIGYVADRAILYDRLTGREFLRFLAQVRGLPLAESEERGGELLALLDMAADADRPCGGYSFGMQRKLALAGALLHGPRVLVLDEPLNGLDPRSARRMKDLFAALTGDGAAIFLSTHDLATAEDISDRVGIIHRGRLVAEGGAAELREMASAPNLEEVFLSLTEDAEGAERAGYDRDGQPRNALRQADQGGAADRGSSPRRNRV